MQVISKVWMWWKFGSLEVKNNQFDKILFNSVNYPIYSINIIYNSK